MYDAPHPGGGFFIQEDPSSGAPAFSASHAGRTFRVFVSSTFEDLKPERNALQEHVFPRLQELCEARGARFQAIDLRWGVSAEAALDQQTIPICLAEVERCRRLSPRPNFVVLLGDRYGWQPLPAEVPETEFEAIAASVRGQAQLEGLLARWYRRDGNAVPAVYVLQPRTLDVTGDADPEERKAAFDREAASWSAVEAALREAFRAARAGLGDDDERAVKYLTSATEQEIRSGALATDDARDHVFAYFRTIDALPAGESARSYRDLSGGSPDSAAEAKLASLRKRLEAHLPGNVFEYRAEWTGGGPSLAHVGTLPAPLDECLRLLDEPFDPPPGRSLCVDVWRSLAGVILAELNRPARAALSEEIDAHLEFGRERADPDEFTGRDDILERVASYLRAGERAPLALHGVAGSGKSAVMARAAQVAEQEHGGSVVLRFVGITPDSSDGRSLLTSLCAQIAERLPEDIRQDGLPDGYRELVRRFHELLQAADSHGSRVLVFVDALDQLPEGDEARRLAWLPAELPERVRVVVSTLEQEAVGSEEESTVIDPLAVLRAKLPSRLVEVPGMTEGEGEELLGKWLRKAGRDLQQPQRDEVLERFRDCPLPLYLKLAFEEARLWKSYTPLDGETKLAPDIPGIIRRNLLRRLAADENHGSAVVSRSLAYLAAARHGLSEDELVKALSLDRTERGPLAEFVRRAPKSPDVDDLPVIVWSRLFFDLEPYLATRRADGVSLLTFHHGQLGQVVRQDYLAGSEGALRHRELERFFSEQDLEFEPAAAPNLRKLSELPYQQVLGGSWTNVGETLLGLEFIHAKTRAGLAYDLVEDFDLAARAIETAAGEGGDLGQVRAALEELGTAYNQEFHTLLRRPGATAQQLFNNVYSHGGFDGSAGDLLRRFQAEGSYPGAAPWFRRANVAPATSTSRALRRTIDAHQQAATAVAVSPSGRYLASGGSDGVVHVWQELDGALVATLEPHEGGVGGVAWLEGAGERFVASAGRDGVIRVWDWQAEHRQNEWRAHGGAVNCLVTVPGDGTLVSCGDDRAIRGFDPANGTQSWELLESGDRVLAVAVAAAGDVVSGGADRTVRTWRLDPPGPRLVHTMRDSPDTVRAVAAHPEQLVAVSGGDDRLVWTWNVEQGKGIRGVEGHTGRVNSVDVGYFPGASADGGAETRPVLAVSGSDDETVRLWDLASGQERSRLHGHTGAINAVAIDPDSEWFASAGEDGMVRIWTVPPRPRTGDRSDEHRARVNCISAGPDSATLVSGSDDRTAKVWNRTDGTLLRTLREHLGPVTAALALPDGRLVTGSADRTIKVWEPSLQKVEHTLGSLVDVPDQFAGRLPDHIAGREGHRAPVTCLAAIDGGRLASGAGDGAVKLWSTESWAQLADLPGARGAIESIFVLPESGLLAAIGSGRDVPVWELEQPGPARLLRGHTAKITCGVHLGQDLLVTGAVDRTVRAWRLGEDGPAAAWGEHEDWVTCMTGAAEGELLVTGGKDGSLLVWDPSEGSLLHSVPAAHEGPVHSLGVDPRTGRVFSFGEDQWLLLWDTSEWAEIAAVFVDGKITDVCVLGSEEVAVGTQRGGVALYRLEEGARLRAEVTAGRSA